MWIVEKNREKSPGCTTHPGSFLLRRGGRVWGNGVSELPSRRLPISQKPLGRGAGGGTFLKKGPPPVFTHSLLIQALLDHGVGHLTEAGDVAAEDVVAGHAEFLGGFMGGLEDVGHDVLELGVDFFKGPGLLLAF